MKPTSRRGVTLVELMVVLVLLGLMAGVVGLAWHRPANPSSEDAGRAAITQARTHALESGTTVRVQLTIAGRRVTVAALPDGSLIVPAGVSLDGLTGTRNHE